MAIAFLMRLTDAGERSGAESEEDKEVVRGLRGLRGLERLNVLCVGVLYFYALLFWISLSECVELLCSILRFFRLPTSPFHIFKLNAHLTTLVHKSIPHHQPALPLILFPI